MMAQQVIHMIKDKIQVFLEQLSLNVLYIFQTIPTNKLLDLSTIFLKNKLLKKRNLNVNYKRK